MIWHDHYRLEGKHALLGASKYSWTSKIDDPDDLANSIARSYAPAIGTALHDIARKHIKRYTKISPSNRKQRDEIRLDILEDYGIEEEILNRAVDFNMVYENLANYVNDAIGFRMRPEQILKYSDSCFGTADAISFDKQLLRIHDLKTGTTPAHLDQLELYAAFFCLEYNIKPKDISVELRIYQNCDVLIGMPETKDILERVNQVVSGNKIVTDILRLEE